MDKTKIDWATATLNPLGQWCYGPNGTQDKPNRCLYCYAVIMAKRGMQGCPQCKAFEKHHHLERLEQLKRWKKPRNIFIQSMGDLFHDEVPDEWIQAVFDAGEAAPWHNYLFLTKNPERYTDLHDKGILPSNNNFWYGVTITKKDGYGKLVDHTPNYFGRPEPTHRNTFLSIEPILDNLKLSQTGGLIAYYGYVYKWVIIGAETGNRKDKVIPRREWIADIVDQCRAAGVPVFLKSSLAGIWGEPLIQEYPPQLLTVVAGMKGGCMD